MDRKHREPDVKDDAVIWRSTTMPFDFGADFVNLVFYGYDVRTVASMVATSVGCFSLAVLNEALKRLRVHLQENAIVQRRWSAASLNINDSEWQSQNGEEQSLLRRRRHVRRYGQGSPEIIDRFKALSGAGCPAKTLDGILYCVQTTLSYGMMLVVMTYSFWLFLSVALGTVTGSAIFFPGNNKPESSVRHCADAILVLSPPCEELADIHTNYGAIPSSNDDLITADTTDIVQEEEPSSIVNNVVCVEVHQTET